MISDLPADILGFHLVFAWTTISAFKNQLRPEVLNTFKQIKLMLHKNWSAQESEAAINELTNKMEELALEAKLKPRVS